MPPDFRPAVTGAAYVDDVALSVAKQPARQLPAGSLAHEHPWVVAGVAGYAGYRLGRSHPARRTGRHPFLTLGLVGCGVLVVVAVLYVAIQVVKVLVAVMLTVVHGIVRTKRTWIWMRIAWGLCALSVVQLRAGRKLPASVTTPLVIGWLDRWWLTSRRPVG